MTLDATNFILQSREMKTPRYCVGSGTLTLKGSRRTGGRRGHVWQVQLSDGALSLLPIKAKEGGLTLRFTSELAKVTQTQVRCGVQILLEGSGSIFEDSPAVTWRVPAE